MHPALIGLPLFVLMFGAIWCGAVLLISRFGWSTLASQYRHVGPVPTTRFDRQRGFINGARYGDALGIGWDSQAIYLDTIALFRVGHPPLRIPFSAIVSRRHVQARRIGLAEELQVRAGARTVRVVLPQSGVSAFASQLPALLNA